MAVSYTHLVLLNVEDAISINPSSPLFMNHDLPAELYFKNLVLSLIHISMVISFSVAKLESVRIAFEVVIFDKFAKSSRER